MESASFCILQAVVAAILDDDLEASSRTQALDRRRPKDVDQSLGNFLLQCFVQRFGDLLTRKLMNPKTASRPASIQPSSGGCVWPRRSTVRPRKT